MALFKQGNVLKPLTAIWNNKTAVSGTLFSLGNHLIILKVSIEIMNSVWA